MIFKNERCTYYIFVGITKDFFLKKMDEKNSQQKKVHMFYIFWKITLFVVFVMSEN